MNIKRVDGFWEKRYFSSHNRSNKLTLVKNVQREGGWIKGAVLEIQSRLPLPYTPLVTVSNGVFIFSANEIRNVLYTNCGCNSCVRHTHRANVYVCVHLQTTWRSNCARPMFGGYWIFLIKNNVEHTTLSDTCSGRRLPGGGRPSENNKRQCSYCFGMNNERADNAPFFRVFRSEFEKAKRSRPRLTINVRIGFPFRGSTLIETVSFRRRVRRWEQPKRR